MDPQLRIPAGHEVWWNMGRRMGETWGGGGRARGLGRRCKGRKGCMVLCLCSNLAAELAGVHDSCPGHLHHALTISAWLCF